VSTAISCTPTAPIDLHANVTTSTTIISSSLALARARRNLADRSRIRRYALVRERAAQRLGLTLRTLRCRSGERTGEIVAAAVKAMSPRTRLFFFSHVLSPTGLVLPAKELCAEARRRGHRHGRRWRPRAGDDPLDLDDIAARFLWRQLPQMAARADRLRVLYLAKAARPCNRCSELGYRPDRARLDERDEFGSTPRIRFYEFEGTRDVCPWLAVPTRHRLQQGLGLDVIRAQ